MRNKENFSGGYGFVIQPDLKTQKAAESLGKSLAPNAEYHVQMPHITLFHAKFENLPENVVKKKLDELKAYQGTSLVLNTLQIYGGKFIFWNVKNKELLRVAHENVLGTVKFLNQNELAKAIEEGLNLNPKEQENIKKYGHPLVLENYLPHITLAYDSRGIILPSQKTFEKRVMQIDRVSFAEMGIYGSVKQVIL